MTARERDANGGEPRGDARAGKRRADLLLVERRLFEIRAKAQAAIAAGLVRVNDAAVKKASEEIPLDAAIVAAPAHPYVSRGGIKLAAGLDHFGFDPHGRVCLDGGASTGGFTQVLLERGARRVYAADVGHGQLHDSLRANGAVVAMEKIDLRRLTAADFSEPPDFITIDVSFISLKLVLPAGLALVKKPAALVALIKPQFEAGPSPVKKGVVRDPTIHAAICEEIAAFVAALGWRVAGVIPSPIEGGEGNREFLLGARGD
jgi:23S rRNA (cytidine1920-2'-O)/16S rRNA (cytidine1409-2'-O)-methyltransferase